jgi:adenylate cyclase
MPFLFGNAQMGEELGSPDVFEFAHFRFDRRGHCLYRLDKTGNTVLLSAGRTALDILGVLVERAGEVVESEEIRRTVWRGKTVEDANLATQIFHLRESVGRNRIQTVSGRGYRFVGSVKRLNGDAGSTNLETPQSVPLPPPRLSIVVLPFADHSEDRTREYFVDALTEDLTTDLSRIEGIFVISRNTAFTYREKQLSTKQIGEELNVRYVLEGSIQRASKRIRVTVQLIDAETDAHLWAERFDRDIGDLFALQDEITSRIAVELNLELVNAEAARPSDRPDVVDYIFRGRALAWGKQPSAENCAEAIGLFEHALTLDPNSVAAQSWLAILLGNRLLDFPAHASDGDLERAVELATKAVIAAPRSSLSHAAKGQVLRLQSRYEEAIVEFEIVLSFNRNWAGAIFALAWCKFHIGSIEETIPLMEQLIRLSPRDPFIGIWYARIGIAHLLRRRLDDAVEWLERARSAIPSRPWTRSSLAVAYAHKDETARAAAEIAEARRLSPDGRYSSIARLKEVGYLGVPKVRRLFEEIYLDGYRKAGMPEE